MSFLKAGSGKSAARLYMGIVVCSFSATMIWLGVKHGVFNGYEATAISTICTGLMGVWGIGKWKAGKNEQKAEEPRAENEARGNS